MTKQALAALVSAAAEHAPLVILCQTDKQGSAVHSKLARIFLNGQEVSRHLSKVEVVFDVDKVVGARLEYIGAAVVVTDGGELTFEQKDVHVTCQECDKTLKGDAAKLLVVEVTPLGVENREHAAVPFPKADE